MAPPLILVAGLGGTCSEAAVSIFDGLEAFYHPGVNRSAADDEIAGCGPRCPLRTEDVQALAGAQHTGIFPTRLHWAVGAARRVRGPYRAASVQSSATGVGNQMIPY